MHLKILAGILWQYMISNMSNFLFFFFSFQYMYNFLAQPNAIVHLDLSNTECSLDMVTLTYIV